MDAADRHPARARLADHQLNGEAVLPGACRAASLPSPQAVPPCLDAPASGGGGSAPVRRPAARLGGDAEMRIRRSPDGAFTSWKAARACRPRAGRARHRAGGEPCRRRLPSRRQASQRGAEPARCRASGRNGWACLRPAFRTLAAVECGCRRAAWLPAGLCPQRHRRMRVSCCIRHGRTAPSRPFRFCCRRQRTRAPACRWRSRGARPLPPQPP